MPIPTDLVDQVPLPTRVLDQLREQGVDVEAVLGRAGIEASRFETATRTARLTTNEFFALWRSVEDVTTDARDFGLKMGASSLERGSSVALVAALTAATVEGALTKLGRYKRITCPEQVALDVQNGEASVRFLWILADVAVPRLLVDATFASFVGLVKRGTASSAKLTSPRRIELTQRRADAALLEAYFGCEIRFGAPVDRLVFDERVLALPFVTSNPRALAKLIPALEAELEKGTKERAFADRVALTIAEQMYGERPTVEKVARALRLSPRTLQRRLEDEGTSYQEVLDRVRQKTARRLLTHSDLDAVEVGFFLGFEEPNSFVRAFRHWEGTTPIQWRSSSSARI